MRVPDTTRHVQQALMVVRTADTDRKRKLPPAFDDHKALTHRDCECRLQAGKPSAELGPERVQSKICSNTTACQGSSATISVEADFPSPKRHGLKLNAVLVTPPSMPESSYQESRSTTANASEEVINGKLTSDAGLNVEDFGDETFTCLDLDQFSFYHKQLSTWSSAGSPLSLEYFAALQELCEARM